MKKFALYLPLLLGTILMPSPLRPDPYTGSDIIMPKSQLLDKIKGGWAGQVIGCTFGGPTEFVFNSTVIPTYQPLPWSQDAFKWYFKNAPGLYDDIYMDLTFVEVLEKEGLDAPASSFAEKFAHARYMLWHANQMARYNILNGIAPPASGHWLNNPHSDDIDFQIEADFAGLMSPGLPNAAARVCDRVGHIMNSGDGYYGGLYVAALYSLAFIEKDVHRLVDEALLVIPPQSVFAQTIRSVIQGHREHPDDWRETWFDIQKKWGEDVGCPDGVFRPFNIDAKINSAWVATALLYGDSDFGKTIAIAARLGDDSDCNPATAGGILGTMLGHEKIPGFWKEGLKDVESVNFDYTEISLLKAYDLSFKQALAMIQRNGGAVDGESVRIPQQRPEPVPLEVGFEGHFPKERRRLDVTLDEITPDAGFVFEGIGFAVNGEAAWKDGEGEKAGRNANLVLVMGAQVDGGPSEMVKLPLDDRVRKPTPFWKYQMKPGRHVVRFKLLTPSAKAGVKLWDVVIYGDRPPALQS